jgi:hypothetical protein
MRVLTKLVAAASLLATQAATAQTLTLPQPVAAELQTVQPAAFEAHVRYLADDRLRGRLPGTPGYQMAVDYVVSQFKKTGVQPAGDKGGFTQTVRLRRAFVEPGATLSYQPASGPAQPLAYGSAATVYPNPGQPAVTVADAPLVFAGYGISAPELKYDDYAGIDVKGKVVVLTRQLPKQFGANERQYFTDVRTLLETAARHGAVGVLLAAAHADAKPLEFPKGQVSALGPDGQVGVSRSYAPGSAQLVGSISAATLQQLFAGAASDTAKALSALRGGKAASQAIKGRFSASYRSRYQDVDSYNVVGKITGSDPVLRNEYVVHSAHLDHLGVGAPINGDSIFNGAHDNATGVASVLEISKLYAGLKQKPRRSILFVLMTGEEMGLIGCQYRHADHHRAAAGRGAARRRPFFLDDRSEARRRLPEAGRGARPRANPKPVHSQRPIQLRVARRACLTHQIRQQNGRRQKQSQRNRAAVARRHLPQAARQRRRRYIRLGSRRKVRAVQLLGRLSSSSSREAPHLEQG